MKPSGILAVLLSASIPGGSFAQTLSGRSATTIGPVASSPRGLASGAIPSLALSLSLPAPSLTLGLPPAPGIMASLAPARGAATAASWVQPLMPADLVPAAPLAASDGAAGGAQGSAATSTEKFAAVFDGNAKKPADETPLDPSMLTAFLVRHGRPMAEITLAEASARGEQARLLTAKNDPSGLTERHASQIGALMSGGAPGAVPQQEKLTVDWSPKRAAETPRPVTRASFVAGSKLLRPFREAAFLAKTFAASLVKPLPSEIMGGLATKSFPLAASIAVYWATVGPSHPLALSGLVALSMTQEIFHGFFLKSWNNFQESLRNERGFNYQMFFNLAYMQGFGTLYRLLSWTANPASVTPPWSVHYWKDLAVMSAVGTFFGVLGYNSLNTLYAKGAIKRWQHSGIQQARDLCFLLAAPFFASGSMTMFWGIFLFQQTLDLALSIWAGRAQARPIVFITSVAVAGSAEFKAKYPIEGVVIEPPLKQAVKAVVDNPLVRALTWPARALRMLIRGGRP